MIKILKTLLDFILPLRCLVCGKIIKSKGCLCSECFHNIKFIPEPYCHHCGRPLNGDKDDIEGLCCISCLTKRTNFHLCRSAVEYDDFSKRIILDFKFRDHLENRKLLTQWMLLAGKDIFNAGVDLIIPVPLYFTRLLSRKYNQSAILSAELSKMTSIPADYKSLKKIRNTLPQVQCNGTKRRTNIKNAFQVKNPNKIKGKRILLIDDVYTTGSTLNECCKVLLKAGATSVDILTVARVCS